MERKLHTHKHTPTRRSKRNCLASSSFQSMNTPPPPVSRARQEKSQSWRDRSSFLSSRENVQWTGWRCVEGKGCTPDVGEGRGRGCRTGGMKQEDSSPPTPPHPPVLAKTWAQASAAANKATLRISVQDGQG